MMKSPVFFSIGFRPWSLQFFADSGLVFSACELSRLIASNSLYVRIEPLIRLLHVVAPTLGYNPLMLSLSARGMAAVYFSLLFAVGPWLVSPRVDG